MSKLTSHSSKPLSKALHRSTMPAFTLYGARGSTNTDRIRLTLAEGGFTDYELVFLDLQRGEQKVSRISRRKGYLATSLTCALKSAEHLKRHPWGKVPTVAFSDGWSLFESRAICTYLAKKYALHLLPQASDVKATALFDTCVSDRTYLQGPQRIPPGRSKTRNCYSRATVS